jgi:hypothetical protein
MNPGRFNGLRGVLIMIELDLFQQKPLSQLGLSFKVLTHLA